MFKTYLISFLLLFLISSASHSVSEDISDLVFDDTQLEDEVIYPEWFKISLGDLNDELKEAKASGKKGIITYFGQKRCSYCKQFFETSLADIDIQNYLRKHYDIIAFDIWGVEDIVDTDGKHYTERELSIRYKTNFTPSLVFYDVEGTPVFRLRGYYPPYKFRAALQYVAEGFYKKETFPEYFARADSGEYFLLGGLNERDFFTEPPYQLNKFKNNTKATAVFFEQGNCHTCDLLHSGPLSKDLTILELEKMNVVQFNMWADTPLTTMDGINTTAKDWAKSLNIFYTPSIVFFDPNGDEIIRVDSVAQFYRAWGVLDYVNRKGYEKSDNYQDWRLNQRKVK